MPPFPGGCSFPQSRSGLEKIPPTVPQRSPPHGKPKGCGPEREHELGIQQGLEWSLSSAASLQRALRDLHEAGLVSSLYDGDARNTVGMAGVSVVRLLLQRRARPWAPRSGRSISGCIPGCRRLALSQAQPPLPAERPHQARTSERMCPLGEP